MRRLSGGDRWVWALLRCGPARSAERAVAPGVGACGRDAVRIGLRAVWSCAFGRRSAVSHGSWACGGSAADRCAGGCVLRNALPDLRSPAGAFRGTRLGTRRAVRRRSSGRAGNRVRGAGCGTRTGGRVRSAERVRREEARATERAREEWPGCRRTRCGTGRAAMCRDRQGPAAERRSGKGAGGAGRGPERAGRGRVRSAERARWNRDTSRRVPRNGLRSRGRAARAAVIRRTIPPAAGNGPGAIRGKRHRGRLRSATGPGAQ